MTNTAALLPGVEQFTGGRTYVTSGEDCEDARHSVTSAQLKPNSYARSGTTGRPRRLLPDNDRGRCPKTTIDVVSMAPSTRLARTKFRPQCPQYLVLSISYACECASQ